MGNMFLFKVKNHKGLFGLSIAILSFSILDAHGHLIENMFTKFKDADLIKRYGVVLAGGGGKRLWPLSRKKKPKQFISFNENKTLLENTIDRIQTLVSPEALWVVTTQEHELSVKRFGGSFVSYILNEPASRNTAPAVMLTVLEIYKKDPHSVIFFVPADHYIPDTSMFIHAMKQAIKHAMAYDDIVLLGVQPYKPASEYGYIEYGSLLHNNVYNVSKFHEKPQPEIAEKYVQANNMLWNTGIFCAKAEVFMRECAICAPNLLESLQEYQIGKRSYESLADQAFDVAILEKTKNCAVVPVNFKWSDVGNLEQFIMAKHEQNDQTLLVNYKASNNLVEGTAKLVVLLDVHDLCVIETEDTLLISRRNETDQVKNVLEHLKDQGYDQYI